MEKPPGEAPFPQGASPGGFSHACLLFCLETLRFVVPILRGGLRLCTLLVAVLVLLGQGFSGFRFGQRLLDQVQDELPLRYPPAQAVALAFQVPLDLLEELL